MSVAPRLSDAPAAESAKRLYRITPPRLAELWDVLASLPEYSGLFRVFVWRQVSVRYRQSILGVFWVVAQPVATTLVVFFMFRIIGADTSGGLPQGLFLLVSVMMWQFFARSVQDGTMSLRVNSQILTKIYFPRVILPLSGVLTAWFEIVVMLAMLAVVCLYQGVPFSPRILLLPVFLVLISFAALSVAMWLAPLNALIRDITFILPFALQFGMFATPVLYTGQLVPPRWHLLIYLNPMTSLIEGVRWTIFTQSAMPDLGFFAINIATIAALLIGGLVVFQKCEPIVVDRI
jgi:lipopolysaccharide transport system permease protein